MAHFIPTQRVAWLFKVAKLLIEKISKLHGLSMIIFLDIEIQNSGLSSRSLCSRNWKLSCDSEQLSETDGQTECLNQTLDVMLRHHVEDHLIRLQLRKTFCYEKVAILTGLWKTLIHRHLLSLAALNHKWTLLRPCWNLFRLLVLCTSTTSQVSEWIPKVQWF
jgi:hypothetical protein